MQEWQYSGGVILSRLFEPNLPDWRIVLGAAAETQPVYAGAHAYRLRGGPAIDVNTATLHSSPPAMGSGVNFLRGDHYRVGVGNRL